MIPVSVVTPSFNQSAFLEQTIRSVLEQDYPALEYFVVDGGSTDSSVDILKKYSDRLAWWTSEKDRGQADAINKGFARAHGEIIAWLNSDDTYLPGAVNAAVKVFEDHPNAVMVYGNMLAVDENGRTINVLKYRPLSLEDLLCFEIIGQPAVFMRRAAFEKAGGLDTAFHFMLDHQLWIKLAQQGGIVHADQTWAAARFHPQAKNRAQAPGFGREAFRILDWALREQSLAPVMVKIERRARASAYRVNARYFLDGGQPWPALKAWMHAFALHPPAALTRMNVFASAWLDLVGLNHVREIVLKRRSQRLNKKKALS
jgi:GT2 family glycosyltransferase